MLYVKDALNDISTVCLHKLSVNLADKINIPHHSDSHCRCMGSMISSTSGVLYYREADMFQLVNPGSGLAMDVEMGTRVIVRQPEEGVEAQMWYEDKYSLIRNKMNDKVLDNTGINIPYIRALLHGDFW